MKNRTDAVVTEQTIQTANIQERFSLTHGALLIQWPNALTEADIADIEQFWPIMLRKLGRYRLSITVHAATKNEAPKGTQ